MGLRKEQVLALLTLGVGVLVGRGYFEEPAYASRFAPTKVPYEAKPVAGTTLAAPTAEAPKRLDFFTEPSETKALEPRLLDFPPRAPLTVAPLPLDPGPDYGHLYALHLDGAPLTGVTIAQAGEAAAAAAPGPEGEAPAGGGTRAEKEAQAARSYDRIWSNNMPFFGIIERGGNEDLFDLEEKGQFDGVVLKLRYLNIERGKLETLMTFGTDNQRIDKIMLAGTLANEIHRRVRKVPPLAPYQEQRRELITWLLEKARENAPVYEEAMKQAVIHHEVGAADFEGLRLQRRVLRARGDLAGELALLMKLGETGHEGAFRAEGLGQVRAQLGLWLEAEADLRRAVQLQPSDARMHASLAEFLRSRDRAREAEPFATRAEQAAGGVQDKGELARIGRIVASCRLALGNLGGARAGLALIPKELAQPYVEGCVQYAAGEIPQALASFRAAGSGPDRAAASLGQAACLVRQGTVQEAHDLLLKLYDQEPLLRHRAASCLALAFLRTNQLEPTLLWLDRALEADPQDPYSHYLRGRALRLAGNFGRADESLTEALRLRDDFVHAIAEMAEVQSAAEMAEVQSARLTAMAEAKRYADRAVELVPTPSVELLEVQGLHAFAALDRRAANAAFAKARDLATDEKQKWYAKGAIAVVDYSRGLVEEAQNSLQRMIQDLGKDEPLAQWARTTQDAIDDHSQKESLGDSFDRTDGAPGAIWESNPDGQLIALLRDGRLTMNGSFTSGNLVVARKDAVKRAKNFLAASVTLQLGPAHVSSNDRVGLGIELQRGGGGGGTECQVLVGIREGKPQFRIQDGRKDGKENLEHGPLTVPGFDAAAKHVIELRLVPRGEATSRQFAVQISWNGAVVKTHPIDTLTGNSNQPLVVMLFAEGEKRSKVDAAFDDFRLERRKDLK